ncbi:hypothetical protein FQA39_LY02039 [Lamprigera yunnana]|nr:hypothetical protein FQA39_LY02039 [Lamprigera yunnana]
MKTVDENDPFHDNDDDQAGCYIPEIDCSDEEPENEVEVAIEIDEEDDVENALNDLGSGVEDLSIECDAVIDEAIATPIDRRPRLSEVQEGPLRGKKFRPIFFHQILSQKYQTNLLYMQKIVLVGILKNRQ